MQYLGSCFYIYKQDFKTKKRNLQIHITMDNQGGSEKQALQNNQRIANAMPVSQKSQNFTRTNCSFLEMSDSKACANIKLLKTENAAGSKTAQKIEFGYERSEKLKMYDPRKMIAYDKLSFMVPETYEIKHVLGKGSYGVVCSAVDRTISTNPAPVAIKKITKIFSRDILLKRAIRELKLMRFLKGHKNIINLVDLEIVYEQPYDGLYCYQELVDYDLARVIHSAVQFSEFHIKNFFYQILCGVKYLHSANVIHRDLKPGNILCTIQGTLKICDFGLARGICPTILDTWQSEEGTPHHITNYVATRWYRAPELILSRKNYSKAVDMWACGCILAELYGRKPVFIGNDHIHQVVEILKVLGTPSNDVIMKYGTIVASDLFSPPKPQFAKTSWDAIYPFASPNGLSLINSLLHWDPDCRLTVEEALEHNFLKEVRIMSDEPSCPGGSFDFLYEQHYTTLSSLKEYLIEEVGSFKAEKNHLVNRQLTL